MPQNVARKCATYGAFGSVDAAGSITHRNFPPPCPLWLCHRPSHGPVTSPVGTGRATDSSHRLLNEEHPTPIAINTITIVNRKLSFMRPNPTASLHLGNVRPRRRLLCRREELQPDDSRDDDPDADDPHQVPRL